MRRVLPLCAFVIATVPATAQWTDIPNKNVPRLANGKPNLAAPAPKTREGTPDLSGVWWVRHDGAENDLTGPPPKYMIDLTADLKREEVPMHPWALAFLKEQAPLVGLNHPVARCLPPGVPLSYTVPTPFKIVQTPEVTVMLAEISNSFRQVFVDGRSLPKDPNPSFNGYSVGRWEKDTFVIETTGFNDKTWLDMIGHPHSEALRTTERLRRPDFGHLNVQITIDDAKAYVKPWSASFVAELLTDTDVMEYVCIENEKSLQHMVK